MPARKQKLRTYQVLPENQLKICREHRSCKVQDKVQTQVGAFSFNSTPGGVESDTPGGVLLKAPDGLKVTFAV